MKISQRREREVLARQAMAKLEAAGVTDYRSRQTGQSTKPVNEQGPNLIDIIAFPLKTPFYNCFCSE
jgi:hypothetical protein